MKDLLKNYIIREAEMLSNDKLQKNVILSHQSNLQSEDYKDWLKSCGKETSGLSRKLVTFLEKKAIKKIEQFQPTIQELISVQLKSNFKYKHSDVVNKTTIKKFNSVFTKKGDTTMSIFEKTIANLFDQLLAESLLKDIKVKRDFQLLNVIKSLNVLPLLMRSEDTGIMDLIIDKYYDKPIVIDSCLLENICREEAPSPFPEPNRDGKVENECECKCNEDCVDPSRCCADIKPYVADLFVVKSEISCYEPSELSHIENVIQSEIRKKKHRFLQREEFENEESTETTSFNEKTHQSDERFSLEKEIEKSNQQDIAAEAGLEVNGKWGKAKFVATSNFSFNQSKTVAQNTAIKESKDILNKAISRVETKLTTKAIHKLLYETEEKNIHVFGGQEGAPNDMSRQFYYVNQVNKGQVYNYGKRMILDFYVPEPSELYKRLLDVEFKLKPPPKPTFLENDSERELRINDVTTENYLDFIEKYKLKGIEHPPNEELILSTAIVKNEELGFFHDTSYSILIPDGYVSEYFTLHGMLRWTDNIYGSIAVRSHDASFGFARIDTDNDEDYDDEVDAAYSGYPIKPFTGYEGNIPFVINFFNIPANTLNLILKCKIKESIIYDWKKNIFDKIFEKYESALIVYEKERKTFEEKKVRLQQQNPFVLLLDIKEQLKQAAISYISCQYFDEMNAMMNKVKPCGYPQMHFQEAEREGEFIRFFEQAFEWKFMNFMLYPYFWARKCTWEDKISEESNNTLFQRFLKAGSAKISISVREGFESHISYFLKFKKIWGETGEPPIAGQDFVPIWQEIKEDKDNFNKDRQGYLIDVLDGSSLITLIDNIDYWNPGNPTASPIIIPFIDQDLINEDIDREIIIDCEIYRIVGIKNWSEIQNDGSQIQESTWEIELDRPIKLKNQITSLSNIRWSTGAKFIGAPWKYKVPTNLVWLRESVRCLPVYPIICGEINE